MNDSRRTLWWTLPALLMVACILAPGFAQAQQTTTGIPCSQIAARHLLMQDNMGAGLTLIQCGVVQGGKPEASGNEIEEDAPQPPNVQVSNRTCSSSSHCTKSESMVAKSTAAGSNTMVVNYNDESGNGGCYSGTSFSTDGGSTWTQIVPAPFCSGHGFNVGDPIVVYNQRLGKFFAGDLAEGCGGFGIGVWSSPDGQNWTVAGCPSNNNNDDRESMWVDNNPFSRTYGRMYVSFNNFNLGSGGLQVSHSDDGQTWSTPVTLNNGGTFIRDVQITGTPPGPPAPNATYISSVFVAGMDEGGGGLNTRQNIMYRSNDGGNTWTSVTMGARFNPPGDGLCASNGYFAQMNPVWRHMGWGEPGVGPNQVVHYAYATKGALSTGDIYYTRSTDNGNTWSTPVLLNAPETNQFQSHWMPSLSVNFAPAGFTQPEDVTVSWYDRRQATSACNNVSDPGCNYERVGIQSSDNGNTWGPNITISSQIINEPAQTDPDIVSCYAGDYDYATALNGNAFITWTDGRVAVSGVQVQNVFFAAPAEP